MTQTKCQCPKCKKIYSIPYEAINKKVACKACGFHFKITVDTAPKTSVYTKINEPFLQGFEDQSQSSVVEETKACRFCGEEININAITFPINLLSKIVV